MLFTLLLYLQHGVLPMQKPGHSYHMTSSWQGTIIMVMLGLQQRMGQAYSHDSWQISISPESGPSHFFGFWILIWFPWMPIMVLATHLFKSSYCCDRLKLWANCNGGGKGLHWSLLKDHGSYAWHWFQKKWKIVYIFSIFCCGCDKQLVNMKDSCIYVDTKEFLAIFRCFYVALKGLEFSIFRMCIYTFNDTYSSIDSCWCFLTFSTKCKLLNFRATGSSIMNSIKMHFCFLIT